MTETAAPELRGSGQLEWLDRLELEHDNLRSALDNIDADPSDEATDAGLRILAAVSELLVDTPAHPGSERARRSHPRSPTTAYVAAHFARLRCSQQPNSTQHRITISERSNGCTMRSHLRGVMVTPT